MAPPQGFEPRNVGIKIRCLRPTWRRGYFIFNKDSPCMYYIKMSMLQFLVYAFPLIVPNSFLSPLNMAPIFVILTQANVHSLRLVATQLGSHGQFRNVDPRLIKTVLFL